VIGADSLQRYWANYSLLNDAIFSRTIQASPEDSLVTYAYDRHYPQYHVFHNPFSESGILSKDNTTTQEYSNGTLYTAKKWPFTPEMTYKREIKTEGERTSKILANTLCSYNTRINTVDSISVSENEYLVITPSNMNANWTMTFNVENTLATNYDVCAIVLPPTIYNPKAELKSCRIQAEIIYVDEKGAEKIEKINTNLENDPTRVDTLVIKENFSFPVCNYGQTNNKIKVKLKCNILAGNKKYSREMFLDCIYLRPRKNMNTEQ
jgi:hypothetical protein